VLWADNSVRSSVDMTASRRAVQKAVNWV
jgi:hypothetical protein